MEEDLPSKWRTEKSRGCNPSLWSNGLQTNKDQKRQRRTLCNGKRINPTRRANYPKYICPNTGAPRNIKQVVNYLKWDLDSHTTIVGDFNTTLSTLDRSKRQKIYKDIQDLNAELDQADLIDIYRMLHPKSTEYTFFSAPYCTYSKIDHIIGS